MPITRAERKRQQEDVLEIMAMDIDTTDVTVGEALGDGISPVKKTRKSKSKPKAKKVEVNADVRAMLHQKHLEEEERDLVEMADDADIDMFDESDREIELKSDEEEDPVTNKVVKKKGPKKTEEQIMAEIKAKEHEESTKKLRIKQGTRWIRTFSKMVSEPKFDRDDPYRNIVDMRDGSGLDGKHTAVEEPCLYGKWIREAAGVDANGRPKYSKARLLSPTERQQANEQLAKLGIQCECSIHKTRQDFRYNAFIEERNEESMAHARSTAKGKYTKKKPIVQGKAAVLVYSDDESDDDDYLDDGSDVLTSGEETDARDTAPAKPAVYARAESDEYEDDNEGDVEDDEEGEDDDDYKDEE